MSASLHRPLTESGTTMFNKYKNKKVTVNGLTFDSMKEANRWGQLKLMERAGRISNLRRQVRFCLIPEQRMPDTLGPRGGRRKGRIIEKGCYYVADFVYEENGRTVVEDTKGFPTEAYKIKRKLMRQMGYPIREV